MSREWGIGDKKGYYNGASYADFDNDGDLDLVVNALNAPAVMYRNNTEKKNYLGVKFEGDSINRFGVGAKGLSVCRQHLQYQQLMLTRGFQSSVEPRLHFGFGSANKIDSMLVVWPDQRYQVLKNVVMNRPAISKTERSIGRYF